MVLKWSLRERWKEANPEDEPLAYKKVSFDEFVNNVLRYEKRMKLKKVS